MNHMCDPSEHFRKEAVPVLAKLATVWMTGELWRRSSIFVDITHWTTTTILHIGQVWNMSKYIQTIDTFDTTNFSSKKHTLKIYDHGLGIFFELVGKLEKLHPGWSPYITNFIRTNGFFRVFWLVCSRSGWDCGNNPTVQQCHLWIHQLQHQVVLWQSLHYEQEQCECPWRFATDGGISD